MPDITRKNLSVEEAEKYSYSNVLSSNCFIGIDHISHSVSYRVNHWDPAKNSMLGDIYKINADYYVDPNVVSENAKWFKTVQGAVDQAIRDEEKLPTKRHIYIELGPSIHKGLVYVPKLVSNGCSVPITIFSRQNDPKKTVICANIDAEMSGSEYVLHFAKTFVNSPKSVKDIYSRIAKQEKITTANASVLRVENNEFRAFNLTIQNTYNADRPPANATDAMIANTPRNQAGQFQDGQHQAVAVMVAGADKVHLENLRMFSFQDTLYLKSPISDGSTFGKTSRTYIRNCYIEGDVDFIFGQAIGFFSCCKIRTLGTRIQRSWVAAPATNLRAKYGFVFNDCDFVSDQSSPMQSGLLSIGRQWFEGVRATPYGISPFKNYNCKLADVSKFNQPFGEISQATIEAVGKCVIMNSRIGSHLNHAALWDDWNGGRFTAEGKYVPENWHPRFRPVQYSAADFVRNLKNWAPFESLDYSDLDLEDVFLGEFNNYYVS